MEMLHSIRFYITNSREDKKANKGQYAQDLTAK